MQIQNPLRLVREKECREITGLSRQTRWRMEKDNKFPKRIRLGARVVAWPLVEIEQWLQDAMFYRSL